MPWAPAPSIVAEALVEVPDALLTILRPGPLAPPAHIAAYLARSLGPVESPVKPPSWLLTSQQPSFRRVLAAIARYRGALLADPVGSGKTFIALAVAAQLNPTTTACLVPASLVSQWRATAVKVGVPVELCSHEQVSRGRLPRGTRGLVIIDESHHFRNPHTRRYRHLAPWLTGRSALLLTATPIVNRAADLAAQLLLSIRDDALTLEGVGSLRALLKQGCSAPALGELVFENDAEIDCRPQRVVRRQPPDPRESTAAEAVLAKVGMLKLSRSQTIAELIRGVFLRAAASSPAAFQDSLRRYRRLLLHARDAQRAGQTLDRRELKHFTRELDDQLVWWELLPVGRAESEIALSDLEQLEMMICPVEDATSRQDLKLERLRILLGDGIPTLVFATSRATVRYLRDALSELRVAWCTGDRAGIGSAPLPRDNVLGWFRAATSLSGAPRHLVVTDVAAEGLDLQRVARVVHYDLPWTPMRVEQREGRAVRYGSTYARVEVVTLALPRPLEQRIRVNATLARKNKLPAALGLGPMGKRVWRWRSELAGRFGGLPEAAGLAQVVSSSSGLLAGFVCSSSGRTAGSGSTVLWIDDQARWTESPEVIESRLDSAAAQSDIVEPDPARLQHHLAVLAKAVRERLNTIRGRRWTVPDPSPAARVVLTQLHVLVREAVRRHDRAALARLEQAIGFVTRGHTAGEAALMERLATARRGDLKSLIHTLPRSDPMPDHLEVKLTGLVLFGPAKTGMSAVASPSCPSSKPFSSISTAP
ncbi:MAG TPA: DEAD/DEAH box helicase [Gemmatimonadales bacterium]|nr:DEAD/DEAH box helicase [Gemmatimonadales bacterium]